MGAELTFSYAEDGFSNMRRLKESVNAPEAKKEVYLTSAVSQLKCGISPNERFRVLSSCISKIERYTTQF